MNELLDKAKQMYQKGTNIRGLIDGKEHVIANPVFGQYNKIYTTDGNLSFITIYDKNNNKWAEIINTNMMTQQEFNDLRVGKFIGQYEILHKYKDFLIVRCEDGHDLFDIAKINKLGLKLQPKTFMGLEVKKYDNVPCEINGNLLVYLAEVRMTNISYFKNCSSFSICPTSIRIL